MNSNFKSLDVALYAIKYGHSHTLKGMLSDRMLNQITLYNWLMSHSVDEFRVVKNGHVTRILNKVLKHGRRLT